MRCIEHTNVALLQTDKPIKLKSPLAYLQNGKSSWLNSNFKICGMFFSAGFQILAVQKPRTVTFCRVLVSWPGCTSPVRNYYRREMWPKASCWPVNGTVSQRLNQGLGAETVSSRRLRHGNFKEHRTQCQKHGLSHSCERCSVAHEAKQLWLLSDGITPTAHKALC